MSIRTITSPEGAQYLKDIPELTTLPKNCLFDKALTGCGGTYLALTDPEPYVIAVPTKALVKDKVTSKTYKDYHIEGISEDYPIGKRDFTFSNKIIVTYKSLPRLSERIATGSYNLLVDEVHMLAAMSGYAPEELLWIMKNFTKFKSYCFMSATIPRREFLPEEIRSLPLVKVLWRDASQVSFDCYTAKNIQNSLLAIMLEHHREQREGVPYFFYNSVAGICTLISKWQSSGLKGTFNVICANTSENVKKLRKVKQCLGSPNKKADFHFITATAFEGVDFFDPEGRTYIISDKSYVSTKYSIETTIPQIVGRIRDSRFSTQVTVVFNTHDDIDARSPREFAQFLEKREAQTQKALERYNRLKEDIFTDDSELMTLKGILRELLKSPHALVKGCAKSVEDFLDTVEPEEDQYPDIEFYPYARIAALQTYDLFNEQRYVKAEQTLEGEPQPLSRVSQKAPVLSPEDSPLFGVKVTSLKEICEIYDEDPARCFNEHYEWFLVFEELGTDVCKSYKYDKNKVKSLYDRAIQEKSPDLQAAVTRFFKVGSTYSAKDIKQTLRNMGLENAKGTSLAKWFHTKRVNSNGVMSYRILGRVTDNL